MEYSKYLQLLEKPKTSTVVCSYCGSFMLLGNSKEGFCHFCEACISIMEDEINDPYLDKLSSIQLLIDGRDFDSAINHLDDLLKGEPNIYLLFGAANIYKTLSDIKYNDLDYNRKGFMEENSSNIYSSLDLTSKSKEMFYKTIRMVEGQIKTSPDENLLYLSFISYIKLKRLLDAEKVTERMKARKKSPGMEYVNMVFCIESGKKEGHQYAMELMSKGNPNAIYYLARSYMSDKKLKEARILLERLTSRVRMPDAIFLLHRIDRLLEETKL